MKVLIVAKTRMGGGACIGGITFEGKSVRLIPAIGDIHEGLNLEYQVGEVWEIEGQPASETIPPHTENFLVHHNRRLGPMQKPTQFIQQKMPPIQGDINGLYAGSMQATSIGSLFISPNQEIPAYSTIFWIPDQPLTRELEGKRIRYRYPTADGGRTLVFTGFQEPVERIEAGTLLRVSLAHWWQPASNPEIEMRCYVQLSGWFVPAQPTLPTPSPLPTTATISTPTPSFSKAQDVLKLVFGFDQFRPLQAEIIQNLLQKRDTLAIMPTGSGKSLCFQLPALLFNHLTIVISPLISLMHDQVTQLTQLGIPAATLNSTLSYHQYTTTMADIRQNKIPILYISPETLLRPEILLLLQEVDVSCIAIDEAHCISTWGHDFRPEYRQLLKIRHHFPQAVCFALTATATYHVREDIKTILNITDADEFINSFDRENLTLIFQPRREGIKQLIEFLEDHLGQTGIIYCNTRKQTEELSQQLNEEGYASVPYHAGLDNKTRHLHQHEFTYDRIPIIVATTAFGMGINKPDVRFIVHYNAPQDIESYYQEIGRAGRDGLPADCLLLYAEKDFQTARFLINQRPHEDRTHAYKRLDLLQDFIETDTCRRQQLLAYFGETYATIPCYLCDNCLNQPPTFATASIPPLQDITEVAQLLLVTFAHLKDFYHLTIPIRVLIGSRAQNILRHNYDKLPTYGKGSFYTRKDWKTIANQLIRQGFLTYRAGTPYIQLTSKGQKALSGEKIMGTLPTSYKAAKRSQATPLYDLPLFDLLHAKRAQLAQEAQLPAYFIFHARTLQEMATYFPQTPESFLQIEGVGKRKTETYAPIFLPIIQTYCQQHNLTEKTKRPILTVTAKPSKIAQANELIQQLSQGRSLPELLQLSNLEPKDILWRVWVLIQTNPDIPLNGVTDLIDIPVALQTEVMMVFQQLGTSRLKPVFETLQGRVVYEQLHLLRLLYYTQYRNNFVSSES